MAWTKERRQTSLKVYASDDAAGVFKEKIRTAQLVARGGPSTAPLTTFVLSMSCEYDCLLWMPVALGSEIMRTRLPGK